MSGGGKPELPEGVRRITTVVLVRAISNALLLPGSDGLPVPVLFSLIAEYAVGPCELTVVAGQVTEGHRDGIGADAKFDHPMDIVLSVINGSECLMVMEHSAVRVLDLTDSTCGALCPCVSAASDLVMLWVVLQIGLRHFRMVRALCFPIPRRHERGGGIAQLSAI